jgi:nucleoside permease NupC
MRKGECVLPDEINLILGLSPPIGNKPVTLQRLMGYIMAPNRRNEIVSPGVRSIIAGTLATCMTGAVVGIIGG